MTAMVLTIPLLALALACASSAFAALDVVTAPIPAMLLMDQYTLPTGAATCNDRSPARYYYRNCSANWDRHAGDPDFCEKGTVDGVAERIWFISFQQGDLFSTDAGTNDDANDAGAAFDNAGWCASADSAACASRSANLTSSAAWPAHLFPSGAFSAYAEQNPNFYKSVSVIVPYCSSDAWLGNADADTGADSGRWALHGARIVAAVFADLFATKQLGAADAVVIVGGAGVMLQVPALMTMFAPAQRVYAVCDGCLLVDVLDADGGMGTGMPDTDQGEGKNAAGSATGSDASSTTPSSSTLLAELARGWAPDAWNASVSALAKCAFGAPPSHSYQCALAPSVIAALHAAVNDLSAAGVLFAQTLLDRVQLAAIGAWPPLPSNAPQRSAFASTAVATLRKISDARDDWARAPFVLGAACFAPTACALSAQCTFATQVGAAPCDGGDGAGAGTSTGDCNHVPVPSSPSARLASRSVATTPAPTTKAALIVALAEMIRDRARAPNDAIAIVDKTFFVGIDQYSVFVRVFVRVFLSVSLEFFCNTFLPPPRRFVCRNARTHTQAPIRRAPCRRHRQWKRNSDRNPIFHIISRVSCFNVIST